MKINYVVSDNSWTNDVLLIKKNGKEVPAEDIINDSPWYFYDYNHDIDDYVLTSHLKLSDYCDDEFIYDGREFQQVISVIDKIKYAFASMHDDMYVANVIKEIFPQVEEITLTSRRYTEHYYLQNWMERFKFDLKDFIMNDKYVVLSCTRGCKEFWDLEELGLIDWDNIEACSEGDEDE